MVLTNFESWAHDGSQPNIDNIGAVTGRRNHDLFNLSVIHACRTNNNSANNLIQCNNNNNDSDQKQQNQLEEQILSTLPTNNAINISHISSNGYYGFSQICQQQNNENAKKLAMEQDVNNMMDIEEITICDSVPTRKRLHESNIYDAKRCRFGDIDSQFDDFCPSSFAPNSLTDLITNEQNQPSEQLQRSNEPHSFMIDNNQQSNVHSSYLQNSTISNTTSVSIYKDMSRCMTSHMI